MRTFMTGRREWGCSDLTVVDMGHFAHDTMLVVLQMQLRPKRIQKVRVMPPPLCAHCDPYSIARCPSRVQLVPEHGQALQGHDFSAHAALGITYLVYTEGHPRLVRRRRHTESFDAGAAAKPLPLDAHLDVLHGDDEVVDDGVDERLDHLLHHAVLLLRLLSLARIALCLGEALGKVPGEQPEAGHVVP